MEVRMLEAKRLGHRAVLRLSWLLLVASVALSTLLQVAVAPPTRVGYLTAGATSVWLLGSFAVLRLLYRAEVSADQAVAADKGSAEWPPASPGPAPSQRLSATGAPVSWPPLLGSAPATPAPWSPSSTPDRQPLRQWAAGRRDDPPRGGRGGIMNRCRGGPGPPQQRLTKRQSTPGRLRLSSALRWWHEVALDRDLQLTGVWDGQVGALLAVAEVE